MNQLPKVTVGSVEEICAQGHWQVADFCARLTALDRMLDDITEEVEDYRQLEQRASHGRRRLLWQRQLRTLESAQLELARMTDRLRLAIRAEAP